MTEVRDRLAIALDVPDLDTAEQLAKEVAPWFGIAKVGLELYSAAGPEAIARLRALDFRVFADLKLHDIPTTVRRAARVLGRQGASYRGRRCRHVARGRRRVAGGCFGVATLGSQGDRGDRADE
jgi:orotidine-5'-phosphate decarboxylase